MSESSHERKTSSDCYPCGTPKNTGNSDGENESQGSCKKSKAAANGLTSGLDRRTMIIGGIVSAGAIGYPIAKRLMRGKQTPTFIARSQTYDPAALQRTIRDGLTASGVKLAELKGKQVLLKPNLVEPSRQSPHMTTHPNMVGATTEVLRRNGARVVIGEASGHVRDAELALHESGLLNVLDALKVPFVDLNHDAVQWVPNRGKASTLDGFYFPRSVMNADLVISMPKMKTHHWVGFTASMKNMYGVIPGVIYGWPKNVLHHRGIPQTVYDINASLPRTIGIVDGILCMEGDGPIMGSPKQMGLVLIGANTTALDATVCRVMGMEPTRVPYLQLAGRTMGPLAEKQIEQRGEDWRPLARPFQILQRPHLTSLRAGELVS